ncbi:MAG: ribosome maturation factor RimP [Oscillospiraceae bacterium]|nr:ribosome maturation factor RimP [Oscillospiraceae bacterium]MDY3066287.1 ribosome maturation factor RimP [Oscillospiraceae bacterium]
MKRGTNKTAELVYGLAKPIADELGLTIWDIRFEKEGAMWVLLVVIDKEGGVSIDDCEAMSRPLDKKLDEVDPIEQSYCLEVSSAGIERELTRDWHFETCKGQQIVVRLIRPYNGVREFVGTLLKLEDATVYLSAEDGEYAFRLNDIAVVRLYAVF